ncbi:uncharacterized protein NPIL_113521 [Nephila pilipes]|uniref:Uncharacterized protein n=1 Tax=Nephila pilipes TaxID=299642 RepID=A0A8X6QW51_NEPPI|nr:uncharacterized protein NPIL_113521 [Nephila pilipes]
MHNFLSIALTFYAIDVGATVYSYGYEITSKYFRSIFLFFKNFLYILLYPTTINLIALLYSILCLRSSSVIKQLTEEILCCPAESFGPSKRFEILKRKTEIDETLSCIEDIFSKPSFFILVANLFICFCTLFFYLHSRKREDILLSLYSEWALHALNSLGCLILFIWIAGEIPIKERKFKEIFYQKTQSRMYTTETAEELRMEKWLLYKPDFVFTGWDILPFRRSTVFAVLGTLITYTVLVLNE